MGNDSQVLPSRMPPSNKEPLSTEVSRGLLSYLLGGNIERGEKIPSERKLAEALGVGRSIVREAMKSLTLLGLVEVRQGDGTYLKSRESDLLIQSLPWGLLLGEKRTSDLIEIRRYLEVLIAELAAERRDSEDIVALEDSLEKMKAATGDYAAFVAADISFHHRLAYSARNEALVQIMSSVRSLLYAWISKVMQTANSYEPTIQEHTALLDAIRAKNPEQARNAMQAHMQGAYNRLQGAVGDPSL